MRASVSALGGSTAMPRLASGSTTMVAPPAVVVTTPTVGAPRAACARRHARQQREALDQPFQRIDARDAAVGQERVGHVVLAGERAGVGDRKLARRGRAAELVGEHRLAARGGGEREGAQRIGALRMVSRNSM